MRLHSEHNWQFHKEIIAACQKIEDILSEIRKIVVGQDIVMRDILTCLLARGNILLEGVPGIAKTLIIKALAAAFGGSFSRIQFTADLLPTDITGFEGYHPERGFTVYKGPIFAHFILADEINRAPPKVQSALLEVMQELQVTIAGKTYPLEQPFIVLATENPIETRGTYPLPEAQLDRFLFKTLIDYPTLEEEKIIMERNVSIYDFDEFHIQKVCRLHDILSMQSLVKKVFLHDSLKDYIVTIINATRNPDEYNLALGKYIEWGASPRASINFYIASKAHAFLQKRTFVVPQDVKDIAHNILRHRVLLSYDARVMSIDSDRVINEILSKVKVP